MVIGILLCYPPLTEAWGWGGLEGGPGITLPLWVCDEGYRVALHSTALREALGSGRTMGGRWWPYELPSLQFCPASLSVGHTASQSVPFSGCC